MKEKIKEWHDLVTTGLVNGLSHTDRDERRDDITWVRRRLRLWESFGRCMMDLETGQDYQYSEKDLKVVADIGYKFVAENKQDHSQEFPHIAPIVSDERALGSKQLPPDTSKGCGTEFPLERTPHIKMKCGLEWFCSDCRAKKNQEVKR